MPRRKGFVPNRAAIGRILKSDRGVHAALRDIAEGAADRADGIVEDRETTDRQGFVVLVDAEAQALEGVGTRAMSGFVSKSQWRRAFAAGDDSAGERARNTESGYDGLPETKGSR